MDGRVGLDKQALVLRSVLNRKPWLVAVVLVENSTFALGLKI